MFGHKKLLTEGAQGQGFITEMSIGGAPNQPNSIVVFYISFMFRFEDGSVGQSQQELKAWDWRRDLPENIFGWLQDYLQAGAPIPVRYLPSDHSKLVLDEPLIKATLVPKVIARNEASDAVVADRIARAEEQMSGSAAGSIQFGSPGAGVPMEFGAAVGGGSLADILQQVNEDPEGFRARMAAQPQGSGGSAFVVTDAGMTPVGGSPARQPTDVADALGKLADLRDRGILTPAEFEAQKQKLLAN